PVRDFGLQAHSGEVRAGGNVRRDLRRGARPSAARPDADRQVMAREQPHRGPTGRERPPALRAVIEVFSSSYPARIRTWTKRAKISCATVTLPGIYCGPPRTGPAHGRN